MESEDDIDMHDANNESGEDDFYSGGDDDAGAMAAYDDSDADVADYEFIDNDSYDSDDLVSHRHQLKLHMGPLSQPSPLPLLDGTGALVKEPISILDRRIGRKGGKATTEILVHWRNTFPEDATWEVLTKFQQQFPDFHP